MKKTAYYRGKRTDNKEWVYGVALTDEETGTCEIVTKDNNKKLIAFDVIPESVCLSTGEFDSNETMIFTEDVVGVSYPSGQALIGVVKFGEQKNGTTCFDRISPGYFIQWTKCNYEDTRNFISAFAGWTKRERYFEVLGNTIDNPELKDMSLPLY